MLSHLKVSKRGVLAVGLVAMSAMALSLASAPSAQTVTSKVARLRAPMFDGVEIGVTVRDLTTSDVSQAKLAAPAGAYVENVRTDGPAERAGLKAGDVIVTFDGERVRSAAHFARLVDETPDGREVQATVRRAGEAVTLKVAPQAGPGALSFRLENLVAPKVASNFVAKPAAPELQRFTLSQNFPNLASAPGRLGVAVQGLTGQLGDYFGASSGLLVTSVNNGTPAQAAGLKAGDVITRINGQVVGSAMDLQRRVAETSGELTLTIVRDRREQTVKATLRDQATSAPRTIVR